MLTTDLSTMALERNLASRALELFCATYGLTWSDSYDLAAHERTHGAAHAQRIARLISQSGCSFADAYAAVQSADHLLLAA